MGFIIAQKKFYNLDFDTKYEIKARIKWGDKIGKWTDPTLKHTTIGKDDIPAPNNPSMSFSKNEDGKYTCVAKIDEVILPNCIDSVDKYIFQIWKWDRKNNALKETEFFLKHVVAGKDEDSNTFAKTKFYPIPKKFWYVMRVRAVVDGIKGPWSLWTSPGSPQDMVGPPTPVAVKIQRAVNGIRFLWEVPSEYVVLNGTVSGSASTNTLTGINTAFVTEVGVGTLIRVDNEIKTVDTVTSDTTLTVDTNWSSTHTNSYIEIDKTEDNISHAEAEMYTENPAAPGVYNFKPAFLAERDRRIFQSKIRFKAEASVDHYGRVRLVDSSGVHSKWISATVAGNSDPTVGPSTLRSKNLETTATFSVVGVLSVKDYKHRWYADHDYTFKKVLISVGTASTGAGEIKVQVYKNGSTKLFSNPNRPTMGAGDNVDRSNNFDITGLDDSDYLTVSVESVGGTTPGEDLTVQVRMERDD